MNFPRIWQAPTGSIAGPELCAAVVRAGGVGGMGLTWTDPETTFRHVSKVREESAGLFLVNYALAFEPLSLESALEAGAPLVTFSWGDPTAYFDLVRAKGAMIGVQVVDAPSAARYSALGVDFLICQGIEAGGHVESQTPLHELLPQVVEAARGTPVIAAGGIADADAVRAVLQFGASGALAGTRFVASEESRAHPEYKQRLVEESSTVLTMCFSDGWPNAPQRVLPNLTLEQWETAGRPERDRPGDDEVVATWSDGSEVVRYSDVAPQIGTQGRIGEMCLYSGTGCNRISDIPSAAEIVRRLGMGMDESPRRPE